MPSIYIWGRHVWISNIKGFRKTYKSDGKFERQLRLQEYCLEAELVNIFAQQLLFVNSASTSPSLHRHFATFVAASDVSTRRVGLHVASSYVRLDFEHR